MHAAADQLLVFHQRQVRLDAGGVAIHHEADRAGGSQHGDLRILVAVLFAEGERAVPGSLRGAEQRGLHIFRLDRAQRIAVHSNDVQHRFAVHGVACEGPQAFGNARGLRIRFAAHQRGDRAGHVAAAVGIIRQRHGHQQRAEVGIAQAQRTELVRVVGNPRRRIAGVIHQDFLRRDGDVHGMAERFHVERCRSNSDTSSG